MPEWPGSDGNDAYLSKTLRYNDIELGFDETVNGKTLFRLWLRAFVASFAVWFIFAFISVITALNNPAAFFGGAAGPDGGGGAGTSVTLGLVGSLLGFVIFWVVLLGTKLPEPIAEWRVLLTNRGDKADSVYSQISGTLRERRLPIGYTVRRIRTGLGPHNVSNRLVLSDRSYTAYVSVFSYGTSLYLGWMMWRSRRGAGLIKQYILDIVEGMSGRRDPERMMLRTERPRAMREALHAACREGLFSAIHGMDVPMNYGFPQGLPMIEPEEIGPAPMPVGAPDPHRHLTGPPQS